MTGCRGDCPDTDPADLADNELSVTSELITISIAAEPVSQKDLVAECPLVSFSKSISQVQTPGFSSHMAHAGDSTFIVDSFAPSIYKINGKNEVERLMTVDHSLTVVGLTASIDYLYVQYMNVTEYQRSIHVYKTKNGEFIKKWKPPNSLGSSVTLVNGHLVISSREKVMLCSPTGKHIKDIPISPRCVKTLCTLGIDSVVLCSTSADLVMKLNLKLEEVCWRCSAIKSPVAVAADALGRVFVLVQPSVICVLDAKSGKCFTSLDHITHGYITSTMSSHLLT